MTRVHAVPISAVAVGDVLARDLCTTEGGVLLGKDTVLDEDILEKVTRFGVEEIVIYQAEKKLSEQEVKELELRINKQFRRVLNDPLMQKIMEAVMRYRLDS